MRGEVARIQEWIRAESSHLPKPKRGVAIWISQIDLLGVLMEAATEDPGRSVHGDTLAKLFNSPRRVATCLRKAISRYRMSGPGADRPVQVRMPERKNLLEFERTGIAESHPTHAYWANAADFARLLVALCREERRTQEDVEREFWRKWVGGPGRESEFYAQAAAHYRPDNPRTQRVFIDGLKDRCIGLEDMHSI